MKLQFKTIDPHSGIKTIEWIFSNDSVTNHRTELGKGAISVGKSNATDCSGVVGACYCPDVGVCEIYNYTITLDRLVELNLNHGDHNRNYFFTVKVTNHAMLSNTEHLEILVDESPPEPGVVMEGPTDSPDIDYTSDTTFIGHWNGFIDHESGIKLYRIGLAPRCLGTMELYNHNQTDNDFEFQEVLSPQKAVRLSANFTGKMFVTVIALNNAMDPSKAICSDGITRDNTPPELRNVTIQHGRWSESIICHNGLPHLLHSLLQKIPLHLTPTCSKVCANSSLNHRLADILPVNVVKGKDKDISSFMCERIPLYDPSNIIYIPNDHIYITWDTEEVGSQIENFHVGFGIDPTEESAPSIVRYTSTEKKKYFKRIHEGIGSNNIFYIFIKATNKAGLEKVTTIGPVLIDATPPQYNSVPNVTITEESLVVGWQNNTFYDKEQTSQIDKIYFQIGYDSKTVTPLLEWQLDSSKPCPAYHGGCFTYPLKRLQTHDTDLGLDFFVTLHVYNNAGHFLKLNTATFKLPSRYPPGNALVFDVDPVFKSNSNPITDIDAHFTDNILCARWSGLKHHESVSLEIGVGTHAEIDDIVSFSNIPYSYSNCISSTNIVAGIKYHFLIRSKCSGGVTLSSSNGVTIYNETKVLSSINVHVGRNCRKNPSIMKTFMNVSNSNMKFQSNVPLDVGAFYHIYVNGVKASEININVQESIVVVIDDLYFGPYFKFLSKSSFPTFDLKLIKASQIQISLMFVKCLDSSFLLPTRTIHTYWFDDSVTSMSLSYKANVVTATTDINDSFALNTFETTVSNTSHVLSNINLLPKSNYQIAVRPCTKLRCLKSVLSDKFQIEFLPPTGEIESSELTLTNDKGCYDLIVRWKDIYAESGVILYQWTISTDDAAVHVLLDWKTAADDGMSSHSVSECLVLPVHPHASMFACIRAYSVAGHNSVICKRIKVNSATPYNNDIVYDFDTSSKSWRTVLEILHSSNAGEKYIDLHEAELDFGTSSTHVAVGLTYASERNVTWYLMTSPNTPAYTCSTDSNCVKSSITNSGFATFASEWIKLDTFYYICAYSNSTLIEREQYTETLAELQACSDGFVIDDKPPSPGTVHIASTRGYLFDLSEILISWDRFMDNVDASKLGYADPIKHYSYALGSNQGGDDIKNLTYVGLATSVVVRNKYIEDGSVLYVSVTGTDHSGLSTTVSSEAVLVDTTPPSVGKILLKDGPSEYSFISTISISLQVIGFSDEESGIDHFEVGIGSHYDTADMMSPITFFDDYTTFDLRNNTFYDGHTYYILLKAVNRAGLISGISSAKFKIDRTPPTGGHVMDGNWENQKDIDYQHDATIITGHWKGFMDPHSSIEYYKTGLGTRPYLDDVEPMSEVGLRTDISWRASYILGQKYYITVEACNGAGLCRSLTSNGIVVDNSPPIPGLVRVGSDERHQKYLPQTSSIHIQWVGFEDPQSSIDYFETCIGTSPRLCDVTMYFPCLLQSNIIKSGLSLPLNTNLYATVRAFNKAGLHCEQSSDFFRVDTSSPKTVTAPTFLLDFNSVPGKSAQYEKSILRVFWKYEDDESPIVRHVVTFLTHHEGHTPVEYVELGHEDTLTINLDGKNWLHDGDKYIVVVTCCNAAGLCSSEKSPNLLIDSSPPQIGGFKRPLLWENFLDRNGYLKSRVFLTWYGFTDSESEIDRFYITVSRNYSGQELTKGEIYVHYNDSLSDQCTQLALEESINQNDHLILTIWARNNVGLNSSVARVSVSALLTSLNTNNLSSNGILEIQKHSCESHFCNNDCTCASLGQKCTKYVSKSKCRALNTSDSETQQFVKVHVFGGLTENRTNITASSSCISGSWEALNVSSNIIIYRYEWSMGIMNQPEGEGIFDLKTEQPWHDIGKRTQVIHCLSVNRSLQHDKQYVIYVRAWYEQNIYAIFTSMPIKVDQTAPNVRKGKFIKDSDSFCSIDLDFIDWMHTITACWSDVFSEQQGKIIYYTVGLGTSLKANDVYKTTNVGMSTNITITNVTFDYGTRYYFTVSAYNNVGLHTSLSSDGFIIDMDNPVAGVVFNTDRHKNERFQFSETSFSLSWHGFVDHFSGIKSYYAAVVDVEDINSVNITFSNVGLHTRYTFDKLDLKHNKTYVGLVKAFDGAGHASPVATTLVKQIDKTPPQGFSCKTYDNIDNQTDFFPHSDDIILTIQHNFEINSLYKVNGKLQTRDAGVKILMTIDRSNIQLPLVENHNSLRQFEFTFISPVSGKHNLTFTMESAFNISVSIYRSKCTDIVPDSESALQVQQIGPTQLAVNLLIMDTESSLYKVEVGVGSTQGGFQIRPLSPVRGGNNGVLQVDVPHGTPIHVTAIAENHAGLKSVFHAKSVIMDKTAPILQNITAEIKVIDNRTENGTDGLGKEILVKADWKVDDNESGLKYCLCAIGSHAGSDDILPYWLAEKQTCVSQLIQISHGTRIYVTAKCVNNVDLAADMTSLSIIVSTGFPNVNGTSMSFIKPDEPYSTNKWSPRDSIFTQSNNTCVLIQWSGFTDPAGIQHYEYRLLQRDNPVVDWIHVDKRRTAIMSGIPLNSGEVYTAEVRAVNTGNYVSDAINADVLVCNNEPQISGSPIDISITGESIYADWTDVFNVHPDIPVSFSVTIGTHAGFNDVIDVQHTVETALDVPVPESSTEKLSELFIYVTCTYSTGMFSTYVTNYKME